MPRRGHQGSVVEWLGVRRDRSDSRAPGGRLDRRAIESFTGGPFGMSGTMTAAGIITRAVQSVPVKRVGYSG